MSLVGDRVRDTGDRIHDADISALSVNNLQLVAEMILSWRTDECPKKPSTPYLLKTSRGPVIAEWLEDSQSWGEWLGGEFYGTGVNCQVLGWQGITPWT